MTTFDSWHMPDGVKIWAAPRLRQPHVEMHERDGPLRVVLLADYEALMRQFEDGLILLRRAQSLKDASANPPSEIDTFLLGCEQLQLR